MADTAHALLRRILGLLPLASGDGLTLDEAAGILGSTPAEVKRAVTALEEGMMGLPAGQPAPFQGGIDPGVEGGIEGGSNRIRFFTTGPFRRPPRLLTREALALALGLRVLAGQAAGTRREALVAAAERLEGALATPPAADSAAREAGRFVLDAADAGEDAVRSFLVDVARRRLPCRIDYLKPGAGAVEARDVEFHQVVHAEGVWYGLAWCRQAQGVRVFRVDRVLRVEPLEGLFEGVDTIDPAEWVEGGRVYRDPGALEVTVRYSPVIARWLSEREDGEHLPDGGFRVRRMVSDPDWLVRHVLQYGGEAVVEEPPEVRQRVAEAARRVSEADG